MSIATFWQRTFLKIIIIEPNKQTSMLKAQEIFTSDCYCFAGRYNAAPITKIRSFFEKEAKTIDHLKAFQAATMTL